MGLDEGKKNTNKRQKLFHEFCKCLLFNHLINYYFHFQSSQKLERG